MAAEIRRAVVQPEGKSVSGGTPAKMDPEVNQSLRMLAHDLSNSLETIMQASYLLAHAQLDDTNKRWLEMVDTATREAARINRDIREILRGQASS